MMQKISHIKILSISNVQRLSPAHSFCQKYFHSKGERNDAEEHVYEDDFPFADVPKPSPKWQRKPYPTPMKVLIRRAKEEKLVRHENPCRVLEHAPENGLLVPHLIEVAHRVYTAWESLLLGLSELVYSDTGIPVKKCKFCSEVHIGRDGHEIRTCDGPKCGSRNSLHAWRKAGIRDIIGFPYCYHLYDRVVKPRVVHKERFDVKRLPALIELCIQAGLELEAFPTKRRTIPVYSIEGRIVDFEPDQNEDSVEGKTLGSLFWHLPTNFNSNSTSEERGTTSELATRTLNSWIEMRSGAMKLMENYTLFTCGYCPEVQVGPKGHKVRMCKATKHQFRDGLHAWQGATIDDLIRPNYVWHVRDLDGPPLANELKRYYGKAPAAVELCVQAGAPVPKEYESMMRLDIVPPDRDEYDLVA